MINRADWLATALMSAGLEVNEYAGWENRGRAFRPLRAVVWHHDASPVGDSPGVPLYMLRQMNAGQAAAQLWVDRDGEWHILASGVAFHAGRVRRGMPGNNDALGIETDHTTGEPWPRHQLDSLRRGTAAILRQMGRDQSDLHFHKTICDPPGRKVDPDGLDLNAERFEVARLLAPPTVQEDDVARLIRPAGQPETYGTDGTARWHVPSPPILADLVRAGVYGNGVVTEVSPDTIAALPLLEVKP